MANASFAIPATNRLAALPIETLNRVLAHLLTQAVRHNDGLHTKGAITRFHSKQPPPLEIGAYLERLTKYTPFPRDAVLLAAVYLNRITHLPYLAEPNVRPAPLLAVAPPRLPPRPPAADAQARPRSAGSPMQSPARPAPGTPDRLAPPTSPIVAPSPLPPSPTISSVERPRVAPFLNSYTLHRLVLSVLLIATKFTADGALSQTRAAKVGGVGAHELCKLEGEGLRLLGWELNWSLAEIESTCAELERVAEEEGIIPREAAQRAGVALSAEPANNNKGDHPTLADLADLSSPPRPSFLTTPTPRRPPCSSAHSSAASTATSASLSTISSTMTTATWTTAPSSASEAPTSQPSSSASSPRPIFSPAPLGFCPRVQPHCDETHREKPCVGDDLPDQGLRRSGQRGQSGDNCDEDDGDDETEVTPPSSPNTSSVEDGTPTCPARDRDPDQTEKRLSPRASCETVRRLDGLQLAHDTQ